MQFERQLSGHRSLLALAAYRGATTTSLSPRFSSSNAAAAFAGRSSAELPDVHSYRQIELRLTEDCRAGEGRSIRTRPEPDRSWRVIPAVLFGLSARLIGGVAACGEFAFSGFLFAFMSWTMAQVLAGCAAYAQAMYPCVIEDDPRERMDIPAGLSSELIPLRRMPRPRPGAAAPVVVEYVVRLETPRVDQPGWSASIASLWQKFRSRMDRQLARRRAIAELRALDDRLLRDVGLSRCDIEHVARHGDRCE